MFKLGNLILNHKYFDGIDSDLIYQNGNRPVIRLNKLTAGIEELGQLFHGALHAASCHAEPKLLQVGRGGLVV